jgi:hypothetical protein
MVIDSSTGDARIGLDVQRRHLSVGDLDARCIAVLIQLALHRQAALARPLVLRSDLGLDDLKRTCGIADPRQPGPHFWPKAHVCLPARTVYPNWAVRPSSFRRPRDDRHAESNWRCTRARSRSTGPSARCRASRQIAGKHHADTRRSARSRPATRCLASALAPTDHACGDHPDRYEQITRSYRARLSIEQLFRTMKTKSFDIEAVRVAEGGPFENLTAATVIVAVQVVHWSTNVTVSPAGRCKMSSMQRISQPSKRFPRLWRARPRNKRTLIPRDLWPTRLGSVPGPRLRRDKTTASRGPS